MKKFANIQKKDKELYSYMLQEERRQKDVLEMIPSENYVSQIETLAIERCKKLFDVPHVNVQPYSGSPANTAVYFALLNPGDKIMGLKLSGGGHLTHGHPGVTFSGKYFNSVQFNVESDGWLDMDKISDLAKKEKPKMLVVGTTAYPRLFNWKKWRQIADSINAILLTDIAHVAGLVAGGAYPSPVPYADVVMFTTHKTIRGPRGAVLMVTHKGLIRDAEMGKKIDRAVFPGLSGGPHDHTTAGIAMALKEAEKASFKVYAKQIVKNSKALAKQLIKNSLKLVGNGTENHMVLMDLIPVFGPGGGYFAQYALDRVGITLNKNTIPGEPSSPFYPSGVRLGTPALTTRGLKEKDLIRIGDWIAQVLEEVSGTKLPQNKDERKLYLDKYRRMVEKSKSLGKIKKEISSFAGKFPIFAWNK